MGLDGCGTDMQQVCSRLCRIDRDSSTNHNYRMQKNVL